MIMMGMVSGSRLLLPYG